MDSFKSWFESHVYRIDPSKVGNFADSLRTYYRSPNWTSSGTYQRDGYTKETGLFAGLLKDVIPYATPRETKWLMTYDNPKRPTVIFNQDDKKKIESHKPHLSRFLVSTFKQVPSGEYFSEHPGSPDKQELIRNPLKFISRWYEVKFVPNVEEVAKELKARGVHFSSEGVEDV